MPIFLIIAIIIAILAVTFALLNASVVTVSLVFTSFESSLALILLVTFGIGVLVGFMGVMPTIIRQRVEISRLKKKAKNTDGKKSGGSSQSLGSGRVDDSTAMHL
jgi:putative membrane protein